MKQIRELDQEIKDVIKWVREQCGQEADRIVVHYEGSGDSFGSFYDAQVYEGNKVIKDGYQLAEEFTSKFEDIIWQLLDSSGADFNNDGSDGTIMFDLNLGAAAVDNYSRRTISEFDGRVIFGENPAVRQIDRKEYTEIMAMLQSSDIKDVRVGIELAKQKGISYDDIINAIYEPNDEHSVNY